MTFAEFIKLPLPDEASSPNYFKENSLDETVTKVHGLLSSRAFQILFEYSSKDALAFLARIGWNTPIRTTYKKKQLLWIWIETYFLATQIKNLNEE